MCKWINTLDQKYNTYKHKKQTYTHKKKYYVTNELISTSCEMKDNKDRTWHGLHTLNIKTKTRLKNKKTQVIH